MTDKFHERERFFEIVRLERCDAEENLFINKKRDKKFKQKQSSV